jgi:hypothetical protein
MYTLISNVPDALSEQTKGIYIYIYIWTCLHEGVGYPVPRRGHALVHQQRTEGIHPLV